MLSSSWGQMLIFHLSAGNTFGRCEAALILMFCVTLPPRSPSVTSGALYCCVQELRAGNTTWTVQFALPCYKMKPSMPQVFHSPHALEVPAVRHVFSGEAGGAPGRDGQMKEGAVGLWPESWYFL